MRGQARSGRTVRLKRWAAALLALQLISALAIAQCDLSGDPISLTVEGFGTAHFEEFETDPARTRAQIAGSVCISGESGQWTILAERAELSGLRSGDQVHAVVANPTLLVDGWRVTATRLESDGLSLELEQPLFSRAELAGSAARLVFDLQGGRPVAWGIRLAGAGFRLEAEQAQLVEDVLELAIVEITTCTCPGEPFYTVTGRSARLDLERESLTVAGGHLELAGVRVPLAEQLELTDDLLESISPPARLEFPSGRSTGLGLVVPALEVAEDLELELGLLGLDADHPLQAFALAHYRQENVSFTVGRARGGPRADFELVQPLAPQLSLSFGIRNQHEAAKDYLHEGGLELRVAPTTLALTGGGSVSWQARLFSAVSAQELGGEHVLSPRLGAFGRGVAKLPTGEGGELAVDVDLQGSAYPGVGQTQYGLRFHPTWRYRSPPLTVVVDYDRQWTDSGSPFSTKLDRLVPQERLSAQARLVGPLGHQTEGSTALDLAYDLGRRGSVPGGLERLGFGFAATHSLGDWRYSGQARLELAGRLDPDPAGKRDANLDASFTASSAGWEAGARARYELRPGLERLSLLELSAAVPLEFDSGSLTPFLALDFTPLLLSGEAPRVSGHGVRLSWVSCCGTITVAYRQQENEFTTSFGLTLGQ